MDTNHNTRRENGVAENTRQGMATDSAGMRENTSGGVAEILPHPFSVKGGSAISDEFFEEMKSLINHTIHELVFVSQHLENDLLQEANETMMTVEGNIEQLRDRLAAHDPMA